MSGVSESECCLKKKEKKGEPSFLPVLIISGGDFCDLPQELKKAGYVIACDRGYQHAERMGVKPDLIVGDFDSAPFPGSEIPVLQAPCRKDDTDTMLAAKLAVEKGCREVVIGCCFGGRLDHAFSNIQTAAYLAEHGAGVRLLGVDTDAVVFRGGKRQIPRRDGWSLSVFSLSDRCEGLCISGTEYTCENMSMTNAFPLGVSNVWASACAEITVKSGTVMVMLSKLKAGEHLS